MKQYDFVVIGSGIAGLSFALKAARHGSVAVITKRKGADTNTAWAQGGIACVTSDEDSFELHVRDTLDAGAGLCDEAVVRTIVTEGPERIRELMELGLHFDEREVAGHRELDLGREGGHSKRRVLHVQDVTGKEIEETLLRELGRQSHVDLLENHMAVDLITAGKLGFAAEDRCLGVYVLDEKSAEVETIRSDRIVLATGGCGKVYLYTTNPDIASADILARDKAVADDAFEGRGPGSVNGEAAAQWIADELKPKIKLTQGGDAAAQAVLADLMRAHLATGGLILAATHGPIGLDEAKELRLGVGQ